MARVLNGNAATIGMLLEAGADAAAASPEGETALMVAARTGKLDAVNALLARGADPNAKESWRGQTALMWAAAEGHAPRDPRLSWLAARTCTRARVAASRRMLVRSTGGQDRSGRGADEGGRRHERLVAGETPAGPERLAHSGRAGDGTRMRSFSPRPTLTTSSRHGCSIVAPIPTPPRRAIPRCIRCPGSGKPASPAATTRRRRDRAAWTA